jgi:hypothetical protein
MNYLRWHFADGGFLFEKKTKNIFIKRKGFAKNKQVLQRFYTKKD